MTQNQPAEKKKNKLLLGIFVIGGIIGFIGFMTALYEMLIHYNLFQTN